jgi:hypothetical protein
MIVNGEVVIDKSLSYMLSLMVLDLVMKVVTNKSLSYVLVLMVLEQLKDCHFCSYCSFIYSAFCWIFILVPPFSVGSSSHFLESLSKALYCLTLGGKVLTLLWLT